nr:hypothetical protein [uncultured Rhodoferax sp.]
MKKLALLTLLTLASVAYAQSSPAKRELIARILVAQQGAIEQTAQAIVERPAMQMQQQAGLALQARVAPEKREAVAKSIQADLKKYIDDVGPAVRAQAVKLAPSTVGALLDEKFTEDELKQLVAIIESPVNKKFAQMGGEFQKSLGEKLVAQSQASVGPKVKALEQSIAGHLGLPTTPASKASEPSAKAPKK